MNLHLVSFGSSYNYKGANKRLYNQATQWKDQDAPVFESVNIFDESELINNHQPFCQTHVHHINCNPRGFGYWIYKSYLISHVMKSLPEDDIVVWIDSGCQLNYEALPRLKEYVDMANTSGIVCFDVGMPEQQWTKMDTMHRILGESRDHFNTGQLISGIVFWKNNQFNRDLVNEWYQLCMADNYIYATDVASKIPNQPMFVEHRHDQSILSLLIKKHGKYMPLKDETYFKNWHVDGKDYPIWATRNNSDRLIQSLIYPK